MASEFLSNVDVVKMNYGAGRGAAPRQHLRSEESGGSLKPSGERRIRRFLLGQPTTVRLAQ
jgi:hypothetical protein